MNATMTMVAQGATALGGALWGLAAHGFGVVPTFLGAAGFALLLMVLVNVVPALRISIDFTASLTFEPAPPVLLSQNLAPSRLPAPRDGTFWQRELSFIPTPRPREPAGDFFCS